MRFPASERRVSPTDLASCGAGRGGDGWARCSGTTPPVCPDLSSDEDDDEMAECAEEDAAAVAEEAEEEEAVVQEEDDGGRPRCFSSASVRCLNALSPMWQ